jgi:hypothetical protein
MRAFAEAWPDQSFVQEVLAQLPWYHQLALLDKLPGPQTRKWYAAQASAIIKPALGRSLIRPTDAAHPWAGHLPFLA